MWRDDFSMAQGCKQTWNDLTNGAEELQTVKGVVECGYYGCCCLQGGRFGKEEVTEKDDPD